MQTLSSSLFPCYAPGDGATAVAVAAFLERGTDVRQLWHRAAEVRGERKVQDESAREMVWILEGWGREEEARCLEYRRATEFDDQLPLPF